MRRLCWERIEGVTLHLPVVDVHDAAITMLWHGNFLFLVAVSA